VEDLRIARRPRRDADADLREDPGRARPGSRRAARAGHDEYDAQFAAIRKVVEKSPDSAAPPDDLAKAIAHALTASKPKTRYHAGHGATEAVVAARTLTDHAKDRVVIHEVGLPAPE
jgi:hypothetical protein